MFLTVLLWLFTSTLICRAAPTLENERCGKPGEKEGATLQGNWNAETYSPGTVATFTCVNGYIRDGPIRMACIEGSWLDISRGQCKILGYCSKPQQSNENEELEGQWNEETFPPGKVATYICHQGYSQTSPIKKACIEGEWITISKGQCNKAFIHTEQEFEIMQVHLNSHDFKPTFQCKFGGDLKGICVGSCTDVY